MNIAYVSFEHPLGISGGGIGTYIGEISKVMSSRGNNVEVFSATHNSDTTLEIDNYKLHLINAKDNFEFRYKVVDIFKHRHQKQKFDIIESAEYGADGLIISENFPKIPLVVKLHTPMFLVEKLNNVFLPLIKKVRFIFGGLIKGEFNEPYWIYRKCKDPEYKIYMRATSISSPSISLKKIITKNWGLSKSIEVIPNPFEPSNELLKLRYRRSSSFIRVTFIGKIEPRKGVINLIQAIPIILKKNSNIKFRFVGAIHESSQRSVLFRKYIKKILSENADKIEFTDFQPRVMLPILLSDTDICIFPSLWENFPNVCLESMSAGKVVIGTNNGGMAEMITHLQNGYLIPPASTKAISKAVIKLAADKMLRKKMGEAARQKVLNHYNAQIIGKATEELYQQIISNKPE
ncbi:glycosyltransferase family 4 protein [Mucilaginibacter sp. SP1R1]|uniref:glycosyltransferase family 4 protein n=1 Tax=Mucilaginibacter sp. SP1R1 TaxID=2723091 RepID=UPI001619B101|nr:glycosyltransferase family 4 protein [Mucilaginibacter sp. SP1R1]MBB6150997.1 glycosyltransferase involved in cell wall biosynthesis [Mucilaginibacter sp. SP1R1]